MTNCFRCGCKMIWCNDFDMEDYGILQDGIVSVLTCSDPECNTTAEFYTYFDEMEEINKCLMKR